LAAASHVDSRPKAKGFAVLKTVRSPPLQALLEKKLLTHRSHARAHKFAVGCSKKLIVAAGRVYLLTRQSNT